jgi:predicted HTH transcriptional regulator
VRDDDRADRRPRVSNEEFLASLRRETDSSLRAHPERLPWQRTEHLESRLRGPHATQSSNPSPRQRDASHERDELVARALAAGPMKRREVENELGLSFRDATESLDRLRQAGRVVYQGPKNLPRWRLVVHPDEQGPTHQ